MRKSAIISSNGAWRYTLGRHGVSIDGCSSGTLVWLLFNPSTATAEEDDATIRKVMGFTELWGYEDAVVINLWAIRGRDPGVITRVSDPVGPLNNWHIKKVLAGNEDIICAWGSCAKTLPQQTMTKRRVAEVLKLIDGNTAHDIYCLGLNADGNPKHPLMLSYKTEREEFTWQS